ncbi:MAG: Nif3-like dinuclear metal center hexameric protein [Planctomycetes bacterium]|nr:Nif3-like dinuclear metal center hexameric protein [Planctomycetota bacterium]
MPTVADVVRAVDRLAPLALAEEWDNVGLVLGEPPWPVRRVLAALDVCDATCAEAERLRADALVVHHPLIFQAVKRLTGDSRSSRVALRLLAARRALIVAHTNLDAAPGGLSDILAQMVGLRDAEPLAPAPSAGKCKIVVFVPEAALEGVRQAAFAAGAGRIGEYAECSFAAAGEGTFRPGEAARPAVGERGRRTRVREFRLEVLADDGRAARIVAAVARVHPYEEPAIDVYPVKAADPWSGVGRVGLLRRPMRAAVFAARVKRILRRRAVALGGPADALIERLALCPGGGGNMVPAVLASGSQAYLTGELAMHQVKELAAAGIASVQAGHYETERIALEGWFPRLAEALAGLDVRLSRKERPPAVLK